MKIRKAKKNTPFDISSLIDVLFILLIFLMLAVRFSDEDQFFPLNLPETKENWEGGGTPDINIAILKTGEVNYLGRTFNLNDFERSVKDLELKPSKTKVNLAVDKEADFYYFLRVAEILKKKGFEDVSIQQKSNH